MYRSASRYDSRAIPEKPSRSGRSSWVDSQSGRPYAASLEDDDRGLSRGDPYLTDDIHVLDRDFQQHQQLKAGSGSSNDLREAQRLAASFFSQYPASSTAAAAAAAQAYRDPARSSRPLSPPEVAMERYASRGQYRDRDVGMERWPDRSNPETLYSSRSQQPLVLEDWEDDRIPVDRRERVDLYGVSSARGRKRDEGGGWDSVAEYDYGMPRKESEYPPIERGDPDGSLRVPKRVDWTGLIRPDGSSRGEDSMGHDSSLGKRGASQNYRGGGRPYVTDSYRKGLEEDLDPEETLYGRRGGAGYYGEQRYREPDVRKERDGFLDEREYGMGRHLGGRGGGRGGARGVGRDDWRTERDSSVGRGQRLSDSSERGRDKGRYDERSPRRPFYSSRHSGRGGGGDRDGGLVDDSHPPFFKRGRGGRHGGPKPDFSQRASITNQDILAVYYGNPGDAQPPHPSGRFPPRRSFPYSGPPRYNAESGFRPEKWRGPRRASRSPFRGRSAGRSSTDFDPSRKGKKRWEKPAAADGTEVKRFKRETQSDKLYLMHNSKATTEEKEREEDAGASASVAERENEKAKGKEEESNATTSEVPNEDVEETTPAAEGEANDPPEPDNGLWDNDDSWTESEEEEKPAQETWGEPPTNEESAWGQPTDEEREHATLQALQSAALIDSKKFLGECSEDDEDDDDAEWESLASDLDDQLDDFCVHQGSEAVDAVLQGPGNVGIVPAGSEAQVSEEDGKVGALSVAQSRESETVDVDILKGIEEGKEVPKMETNASEDVIVKEGSVGGEKKKVGVLMEELQESVKNREDKAFDYYVSLFEQDTDLMKLYEANVNCGSFECLVCAGVGAKKKKRFPDVASLVQHAKKILRTKKLPEHRGFARAVCKILGWETVAGPSVILPRGCIAPQDPEAKSIPNGALDNQKGGGSERVGMDWEWASARKLFEEQGARIDGTAWPSVEVPQTGSVSVSESLMNEAKNPSTTDEAADLVTSTDATMMGDNATGVEAVSVPGKAVVVETVSIFVKTTAVEARVTPEEDKTVKAIEAPEKATSVKSNVVLGATTLGKPISVWENASVVESLELSTRVLTGEREEEETVQSSDLLREEASKMAVEMWAPLAEQGIGGDDSTKVGVVNDAMVGSLGRHSLERPFEESGELGVVASGHLVNDAVGKLSGEAASEDASAATLSPRLRDGANGNTVESQKEDRLQNGSSVGLCVTGSEAGGSADLQVWDSNLNRVVKVMPVPKTGPGLGADILTDVLVAAGSMAASALPVLQAKEKDPKSASLIPGKLSEGSC